MGHSGFALLAGSSYALRRLHREGGAGQRVEAAFRVLRETKDYPADRIVPIDAAHGVVRAWADQYTETGRLDRAAQIYQELLEMEMASNPDPQNNLRNATYISNDEVGLIGILRNLGRKREAADVEARRQALWEGWKHKLPNNSFVLRQMAVGGN